MNLFKDKTLKSPVDFDNAMYFAIPVTVWQNGKLIDYGGKIERHTDEAVFINDGYFLKDVCEFRIR
jgi:hypothetical protein